MRITFQYGIKHVNLLRSLFVRMYLVNGWFGMKTRNAFTTSTICVLSAITIANFVNPHKVEAQPIRDCRQLVTGTYLTRLFANFGSFRGITTFNRDGNFIASASIQSGVPNIPPFRARRAVGSVPHTDRLLPRDLPSITQQRHYLPQLSEPIYVRHLILKMGQ